MKKAWPLFLYPLTISTVNQLDLTVSLPSNYLCDKRQLSCISQTRRKHQHLDTPLSPSRKKLINWKQTNTTYNSVIMAHRFYMSVMIDDYVSQLAEKGSMTSSQKSTSIFFTKQICRWQKHLPFCPQFRLTRHSTRLSLFVVTLYLIDKSDI